MAKTKKCTEVEGIEKNFLLTRARRHAFTWFDYTKEDIERIKSFNKDDVSYLVAGYEICPKTGKEHLQGYVEWPKALSGAQMLKKLLGKKELSPCPIRGGIVEKCRLANIRYCKKADTKNANAPEPFFEIIHNERKQGARNDIYNSILDTIKETGEFIDVLEEFPEEAIKYHAGIDRSIRAIKERKNLNSAKERFINWKPWVWQKKLIDEISKPCTNTRTIIWYSDPEGKHGKSDVCDWITLHMDAETLGNGRTADMACAWQGKPIVMVDLSRTCQDHVNYDALEAIKQGRMFSPKYMSCTKRAPQMSHVIVFANWEPNRAAMTADKLLVRTIDPAVDCIPWEEDLSETEDADTVNCIDVDTVSEPVIVGNYKARPEEDNIASEEDIFEMEIEVTKNNISFKDIKMAKYDLSMI